MQQAKKFTDKSVQSLRARAHPYRIFEKGNDEGFGVQVSASARTFFVQYHSPVMQKRRFMKLGSYPETSLAEARKRCRDARSLVQAGKDPQIERDRQQAEERQLLAEVERNAEIERNTGTVKQLFDAYIAHLKGKGTSTAKDVENLYKRDIKKAIGGKKARNVTPRDVRDILEAIFDRGAKTRANRAHAYMRAAFSFGIRADHSFGSEAEAAFHLETNPVRDIQKPTTEQPGDRDLSETEVRNLWSRLDTAGMQHATKTALRLLFATGGQRVEEVLGMRWDEVDFEKKLWELKSGRTKNGRPHVVPLSNLAIELIKSMKPLANGEFVFPNSRGPERHYHPDSLGKAVRRFCEGSENNDGFPAFTPRDIRRTVKSRMGEIGIAKEVRDRLQNHALQDVSSKHYDRYDYLEPKQTAMTRWTNWLEGVIRGDKPNSNIVRLAQQS